MRRVQGYEVSKSNVNGTKLKYEECDKVAKLKYCDKLKYYKKALG